MTLSAFLTALWSGGPIRLPSSRLWPAPGHEDRETLLEIEREQRERWPQPLPDFQPDLALLLSNIYARILAAALYDEAVPVLAFPPAMTTEAADYSAAVALHQAPLWYERLRDRPSYAEALRALIRDWPLVAINIPGCELESGLCFSLEEYYASVLANPALATALIDRILALDLSKPWIAEGLRPHLQVAPIRSALLVALGERSAEFPLHQKELGLS